MIVFALTSVRISSKKEIFLFKTTLMRLRSCSTSKSAELAKAQKAKLGAALLKAKLR